MNRTLCILLLAFIIYLFLKRGGGAVGLNENVSTVHRGEGGILFSVPNNPEPSRDSQYMLVISGMYKSNPTWMLNEIPRWLRDTRYIAISPYTNTVETALYTANKMSVQHKGYEMGLTSITGFSSGGSRVMTWYNPPLHRTSRMMLLDFAISEGPSRKDYDGSVIFLYGSTLHARPYGDEYARITEDILTDGGIVEKLDISHYAYPRYAFNKFGNLL